MINKNLVIIILVSLLIFPVVLSVLDVPVCVSFAIGIAVCIIGLLTKD